MKKESLNNVIKKEHPRHLKEGVRHIIAAIGTPEWFRDNPGAEQQVFREYPFFGASEDKNENLAVDYFGTPERLERQGFKNQGEGSYVISTVGSADKTSDRFINCTGIIVAGKDKETGVEISFLSH